MTCICKIYTELKKIKEKTFCKDVLALEAPG